MLPAPYSPQHFILAGVRPVRDDEQQFARETMQLLPRRIGRAVLLALVMWPLCIGPLLGLDVLFGPDDESWLKLSLAIPFMIGIVALPAVVVCLAFDIRGDWSDARFVLGAAQIEMWQRRPPEEFEEPNEAFEIPRSLEVVAGTDKIWTEDWDDNWRDEWDDDWYEGRDDWNEDAQLSRPGDS